MNFWNNYLSSGIKFSEEGINADRVRFINAFSILGVATLVGFGIDNLLANDPLTGWVELAFGLILAVNTVLLRKHKSVSMAAAVMLISQAFPLLLLLFTGGIGGTGLLWFDTFPLVAFLLLGKWNGIAASVGLITIILLAGLSVNDQLYYPPIVIRQLFFNQILIVWVLYFYEQISSRTRHLLEEKKLEQDDLVNSKTDELRQKTIALESANKRISKGWMQIQKEKARLMSSIDNLPIGLVMTDNEYNIILANHAVYGILDHGNESLGSKINSIVNIKKLGSQSVKEKSLLDAGQVEYFKKFVKIHFAPVLSGLGEFDVIGTVILLEDVTRDVQMEKSKDEFFAMATHELQTPLTAIRGNAEILDQIFGNKINNQDFTEMIDDIRSASKRLIDLVNDLLNMSKLELGKIRFDKEKFSLPKLIAEVLRELETTAKDKNIDLKFLQSKESMPLAFADRNRAQQVLINLVGNAIKFTDKGYVTIKLTEEQNQIFVKVIDTGIGIDPEKNSKLFSKFEQAVDGNRENRPGTGLGLYISKLMVEGMGGKLYLKSSELGKGSVFEFTLPIYQRGSSTIKSLQNKKIR